MSVVAWDGTTLAADRQATAGSGRIITFPKMQIARGACVATVGRAFEGKALIEWYAANAQREAWPEFQESDDHSSLIVLEPDGRCFFYGELPIRQAVMEPCAAWGCGAEAALGAMMAGVDAVEAVLIASRIDSACGRGVTYSQRFENGYIMKVVT